MLSRQRRSEFGESGTQTGASSMVRVRKGLNICLCYEFICPRSFSLMRPTSWNRLGALVTTSCLCSSDEVRTPLLRESSSNDLGMFLFPWFFSTPPPPTRPMEQENNPFMSPLLATRLPAFSQRCWTSWSHPRQPDSTMP